MAIALSDALNLIGGLGNVAGIQGDNPSGLNALQRMALSPEQQAGLNQQSALAALAQNPDFRNMSDQDKMTAIAGKTGALPFVMGSAPMQSPSSPQSQNDAGSNHKPASIANQQSKASTIIGNSLNLEGGATPSDGATNAPAIFGINAKWHPNEYTQAKQLNDTQGQDAGKAYAADFYKKNYWDANKLDSLPAPQAQVVFDGMINHTPAFGQQLLGAAKAGASPGKLISMRDQEYQRLANSDPASYENSLPGWQSRLKQIKGYSDSVGQQPPAGYPQGLPFQNVSSSSAPSELPEVTDLRQSIAQTERARLFAPPEKWPEIDAKIGDLRAKLLEFSPAAAGARTKAQQEQTYHETAEKNLVLPGQSPIANANGYPSTLPPSVKNVTPDIAPQLTAKDGKPILSGLDKTFYPADPSGTPLWNQTDSTSGVQAKQDNNKIMDTGVKAFSGLSQNLQSEGVRAQGMINMLKQVESGTITAMNPELFQHLAALGIKADPASLKTLSDVQALIGTNLFNSIQQMKDNNSNFEGAPIRTFGSEINALLSHFNPANMQPAAVHELMAQSKALLDHGNDMVNGWNTIGGRGNRQAGGYTKLPDDYVSEFNQLHPATSYAKMAYDEIGKLKGEEKSAAPQEPAWVNMPTGGKYKVVKQ